MKKINILSCIILCVFHVKGQTTFNNSYPFNYNSGVFTNVFFQHQDTVIVTGSKSDSSIYNSFTMKFDRYGSPEIKVQSTNIVFVRNTIFKNKEREWGVLSGAGSNIQIVFFNTDSITKIISTPRVYNQIAYTPNYLLKDNEGNYIIGGEYGIPATPVYRVFLIKLDSLGNLIWRKEYGNTINTNMIRSLALDTDGGYLIGGGVGNLYTYQSGTLPECQATIFKTDTAGTMLWQWQDTAHYCSMQAFGLQPTDDNGYIYTNWQATIIDTSAGVQFYYGGRYFITKINSNRELIFKKVFGGLQSYDEGVLLYTLKKADDGNFIAVGHRFLNDSLNNNLIIGGYGYIVKFSSNGNIIWQRTYANVINPLNFTYVMNKLYDFDFKADGGIIACGDVLDLTAPSQQQKAWLLSLDNYGCLSAGCQLFDAVTDIEKQQGVFKAYPNPATDVIYIQHLPGFETQPCELQLTDITGKIIMQQKLINQEVTYILSTENFANGIYFLSLKTASGLVQTEKVIIAH